MSAKVHVPNRPSPEPDPPQPEPELGVPGPAAPENRPIPDTEPKRA